MMPPQVTPLRGYVLYHRKWLPTKGNSSTAQLTYRSLLRNALQLGAALRFLLSKGLK
jgi:hypothetical protein